MKLAGKTVLITGSTDGVGRVVAKRLAAEGARVLVHGRNLERGESILAEITPKATLTRISSKPISLRSPRFASSRLRSTRARRASTSSSTMPGIGSGGPAGKRELSADGFELRFAVNYLAGFLLTRLLLPKILASTPSRIVNVASLGQAPIDFDDVMITRGYTVRAPIRKASSRRSCSPSIFPRSSRTRASR